MCQLMRKLVLLAILLAFIGCRREDIKECVLELPTLSDNAVVTQKIVKAIEVYQGVDTTSLKWNFVKKTLSLRYDSMQVAKANLRYAIEEVGIDVR